MSPRHNANAENPELDDARPLPVGKELWESTTMPTFPISLITFDTDIFWSTFGSYKLKGKW